MRDTAGNAREKNTEKTSLEGTIFFLNLPREKCFIEIVERTLCERGATLSYFLNKNVTHIVIDNEVDLKEIGKCQPPKNFVNTRSMRMIQKSQETLANNKLLNTLSGVEQALKFGIKVVRLSEIVNPCLNKDVLTKTMERHVVRNKQMYVADWLDKVWVKKIIY